MKNIPKTIFVLCLIASIEMLSGCFTFRPYSPQDKLNKKQLKKLPESEIVFTAKYLGTQTGTQLYFREDSIFSLQTQTTLVGWEQFIGNYTRIENSDTFILSYHNEHNAKWKYVIIDKDKALLKVELNDSLPKQYKTFQVLQNAMKK